MWRFWRRCPADGRLRRDHMGRFERKKQMTCFCRLVWRTCWLQDRHKFSLAQVEIFSSSANVSSTRFVPRKAVCVHSGLSINLLCSPPIGFTLGSVWMGRHVSLSEQHHWFFFGSRKQRATSSAEKGLQWNYVRTKSRMEVGPETWSGWRHPKHVQWRCL